MVIHEIVAAGCCDGLELMVGKPIAKVTTGSCEGVVKLIVGVVHLIYPEHCLEAPPRRVGSCAHQWKFLDERFYLLPHIREHRSAVGVCRRLSRALRNRIAQMTSDFLVVEPLQAHICPSSLQKYGDYFTIGFPQYSFLPQSRHLNPAHTESKCSIAAATSAGSSVSMPASKLRLRPDFIPIPAPVRLAEPM